MTDWLRHYFVFGGGKGRIEGEGKSVDGWKERRKEGPEGGWEKKRRKKGGEPAI